MFDLMSHRERALTAIAEEMVEIRMKIIDYFPPNPVLLFHSLLAEAALNVGRDAHEVLTMLLHNEETQLILARIYMDLLFSKIQENK